MTRLDISSGSSSLRLEVNAHAKLKALMEISRNLGRTMALDDVLPKVLDSLLKIFPQADRGVTVLRDAASGKLIPGPSGIAARSWSTRSPHQPHDRARRDGRQGSHPLGRCLVRFSLQGLGKHRRFPYPLRDVRR